MGFAPIAGGTPRVLILGSMPGEESLRRREYYANKRNSFWFILGNLLGFNPGAGYAERKTILKKNGLAVWDVLMACEREGSLDSSIVNASSVENDLLSFYAEYPTIKYVFFNGTKAEAEYKKRILPLARLERPNMLYRKLPSTSPTMARLTKAGKLSRWSVIHKKLNPGKKTARFDNTPHLLKCLSPARG